MSGGWAAARPKEDIEALRQWLLRGGAGKVFAYTIGVTPSWVSLHAKRLGFVLAYVTKDELAQIMEQRKAGAS